MLYDQYLSGSVLMFITKEEKNQQEQNGLMELCGLKNTGEEKLEMRERERTREMFMLLFLFKTIATEDQMESYSSAAVIFFSYERLLAVPCNEAIALSSSLSYSLNHSGRSRLSKMKSNKIPLPSTAIQIYTYQDF